MIKNEIQFIREVCIKANPDIRKLDFGCVIKDWKRGTGVIIDVQEYEGESDCYDVAYLDLPDMQVERSPMGNWDIVGRPVRLADFLYAIEQMKKPVNDLWYKFTKSYDLRNDDITLQSDEVVKIIVELLKSE